uniref:Uncharacterized protein n=1 Tax=Leersia perrieri TaxID=77586 RepID=A0A0D9WPX4_9ORYZ
MASTEDNHSRSLQSLWRLSLFYPNLERVIANVQSRRLVDPVYICVECTVVHESQPAMAAHCRIHIHFTWHGKGECEAYQTGIIGASDLLQKCVDWLYSAANISESRRHWVCSSYYTNSRSDTQVGSRTYCF